MNVRFDAERGILRGWIRGRVTADDVREEMARLLASGAFPADASTIWDFSDLDFSTVNREFQEQLISVRKQFPERGNARVAFVVPDEAGFGLMRMYGMRSAELPQQMAVFRSVEEAEAWLESE